MTQRSVLVVLFDDLQSLDVTGPMEVFTGAGRHSGDPYEVRTASLDGAPVRTSSNLTLVPDGALAEAEAPHTLLVPGGNGTRHPDPRLIDWLREHAPRAERIVSVCTGALLLAEAGLLDGHRATTHWSVCDHLARTYPAVDVDPDPIFVRDGKLATSAESPRASISRLPWSRRTAAGTPHSPSPAISSSSSGARETRPSSAPSSPSRSPGANRCATSSSGSPSTPTAICPSRPSRNAPASRPATSPGPSSRRPARHPAGTSSAYVWNTPGASSKTRPTASDRSPAPAATAPRRRCAAPS